MGERYVVHQAADGIDLGFDEHLSRQVWIEGGENAQSILNWYSERRPCQAPLIDQLSNNQWVIGHPGEGSKWSVQPGVFQPWLITALQEICEALEPLHKKKTAHGAMRRPWIWLHPQGPLLLGFSHTPLDATVQDDISFLGELLHEALGFALPVHIDDYSKVPPRYQFAWISCNSPNTAGRFKNAGQLKDALITAEQTIPQVVDEPVNLAPMLVGLGLLIVGGLAFSQLRPSEAHAEPWQIEAISKAGFSAYQAGQPKLSEQLALHLHQLAPEDAEAVGLSKLAATAQKGWPIPPITTSTFGPYTLTEDGALNGPTPRPPDTFSNDGQLLSVLEPFVVVGFDNHIELVEGSSQKTSIDVDHQTALTLWDDGLAVAQSDGTVTWYNHSGTPQARFSWTGDVVSLAYESGFLLMNIDGSVVGVSLNAQPSAQRPGLPLHEAVRRAGRPFER